MSFTKLFSFALFTGAIALGTAAIFQPEKNDFVLLKPHLNHRIPAALKRQLDLTSFAKNPVRVLKREQFFSHVDVVSTADQTVFNMPQFAADQKDGTYNLACLVYDRIELTFHADGVVHSTGTPELRVESPCGFFENNISKMNSIVIPTAELKARDPSTDTHEFAHLPGKVYRTNHIYGSWPKSWVLKEVRFTDLGDLSKDLVMSHDLGSARPERRLLMKW